MKTMRAKFRVTQVEVVNETYQNVTMHAVSEAPFDQDGVSEDNSFARWTPSGELRMAIQNPDLMGVLQEGQKYYLDFTPAVTEPAKEPEPQKTTIVTEQATTIAAEPQPKKPSASITR